MLFENPLGERGDDVARFSLVNRRARRLCADEQLWRELCGRHFNVRFMLPMTAEEEAEEELLEEGWRRRKTWRSLYAMYHEVLYSLFRRSGRRAVGGGSSGVDAGLSAISQGRLGGISIPLGA